MSSKRSDINSTIKVYDEFAVKYSEANQKFEDELGQYVDEFLEYIDGSKILDAGCGPGKISKHFIDKGYEVTGVDLSSELLEIARRNAPTGTFLKKDLRNLNFPPNSFDAVWCSAALLHLPKKDARVLLQQLHEFLNDKGCMYVDVEKGTEEKMVYKEFYGNKGRFIAFYTVDEFKDAVLNAGFNIEKVSVDSDRYGWIRILATK